MEKSALDKSMEMPSIITRREAVYVVTEAGRWVHVIMYWECLE